MAVETRRAEGRARPRHGRGDNLYVNLSHLQFVSLNPEGKERWRTTIAGFSVAAPVIGRCGKLCQLSHLHEAPQHQPWIEVFSLGGRRAWTYEMEGAIEPVVLALATACMRS